jgi:hypothetical protein
MKFRKAFIMALTQVIIIVGVFAVKAMAFTASIPAI